jgi:DNA-binding TFAR19-related protein (PDSD5 family)
MDYFALAPVNQLDEVVSQSMICKIFDSILKDVKKSFKIVERPAGA